MDYQVQNTASDEKRLQIIRAAITVLSDQNYQNMKTASVAAEAGIAEGTIYRYFTGKKDLFVAVLDHICGSLSDYFISRISPNKGLKENLTILRDSFVLTRGETSIMYKILYKAFSEVEDEDIRQALGGLFSTSLKRIQTILQACLESEKISVSEEKLETVLMMIWGIGDIIWKRQIILGDTCMDLSGSDAFVDMLYSVLRN